MSASGFLWFPLRHLTVRIPPSTPSRAPHTLETVLHQQQATTSHPITDGTTMSEAISTSPETHGPTQAWRDTARSTVVAALSWPTLRTHPAGHLRTLEDWKFLPLLPLNVVSPLSLSTGTATVLHLRLQLPIFLETAQNTCAGCGLKTRKRDRRHKQLPRSAKNTLSSSLALSPSPCPSLETPIEC